MMEMFRDVSEETLAKLNDDVSARESIARIGAWFVEISISMMQESPAFRKALAQAMTEFLKHPEFWEAINQSMTAYREFLTDPHHH